MKFWDLIEYDVEYRKPEVIGGAEEGRAILINLPAGESLSEHQVKERATVVVIFGRLEISPVGGEKKTGGAGSMVVFEPSERHSVTAVEDTRFLLLLSPWSLEDHSSIMPWSRGES